MQLKRLSGAGFLSYPTRFDLDFSQLGTIIAVSGPNGAGKSTLLELFPAALYRRLPTRGALKDVAVGRNTFVEAEIVNGKKYTIRQTVDAFNEKAEVSVLDENGEAVLTSGKVSEFDKWAETHLPPPAVFYSSLFAAQKSEGLLGMKKGDRKAVIIRVLGLERLEVMAERARKYKQNVETTLAGTNAGLNELGDVAAERAKWSAKVIDAEKAQHVAEAEALAAELELSEAKKKSEAREQARTAYDEAKRERQTLSDATAALQGKKADIELRLRNNRELAADAAEINAAVKRIAELDELIKAAEATNHALRVEEAELAARDRDLTRRQKDAATRNSELNQAIVRADLVLAEEATITEACKNLAAIEKRAEQATAARDEAQAAIDALRAGHLNSKDTRLHDVRESLRVIAHDQTVATVDDLREVATSAEERDDAALAKEQNFTADEARLKRALADAGAELLRVNSHLVACQRYAGRKGELDNARTAKAEAVAEKAKLDPAALAEERTALDTLSKDWSDRWAASSSRLLDLRHERQGNEPTAAKADSLARTEARITELVRLETEVNAEIETTVLQLQSLPPLPEEPGEPVLLMAYEFALDQARKKVGEAATELAISKSRLEDALARDNRRLELLADRNKLQNEIRDWTRLAMDLGRDGLQALEIDAAGPELTTLANDLLRACGDTRFSVDIVTTKTSADGKRELEGCEIMVSDSVKGTVQEGETLSGGEATFVGEAIRSAVTMMGCRRNGVTSPTLVRDESGAALDPERAPQYMAMLRITADIIGASNVLLVSHNPDLLALADNIVRVGGGQVQV
jgi:DNA repair protein SbcC/Rad50